MSVRLKMKNFIRNRQNSPSNEKVHSFQTFNNIINYKLTPYLLWNQ